MRSPRSSANSERSVEIPDRLRAAFARHPSDRRIFALAVPALGALAADPIYSLVDTAFVGHLGTPQLGAVAIGTAAFTASFWLFSFLAYGVTPRVAGALGRGDASAASATGVQALFLAVILGAAVTILGVVFAGVVVRGLGGSGPLAAFGEPYLRIRILSAIPVLVAQVGHGWMRGDQNTRTPMVVAVSGAVTNVALDYIFIFTFDMGVEGAAWATVTSQFLVATWFVVALLRRFEAPVWRVDREVATGLLVVGADLAVRTGSLLAALTIATSVAARMGQVPLAAWQIAMQVFLLLALTLDSIAIAAQALVGRHLGSGDPEAATDVGWRLLGMGAVLGMILLVVVAAVAGPAAGIFTDDARVIDEAAGLLMWVAAIQPLSAAAFTLDGVLIGASDTRFLAVSMAASSVVFAGIALVALAAGWGTGGLAAGATIWLLLRTGTTGARFVRGRWAA